MKITNELNLPTPFVKADEKAERYGGLLCTLYDTIHAKAGGDDYDHYDVIHQLIDDWYEEEKTNEIVKSYNQ